MYAVNAVAVRDRADAVTRFVIVKRDGKAGLKESRLSLFDDDEDEEEC